MDYMNALRPHKCPRQLPALYQRCPPPLPHSVSLKERSGLIAVYWRGSVVDLIEFLEWAQLRSLNSTSFIPYNICYHRSRAISRDTEPPRAPRQRYQIEPGGLHNIFRHQTQPPTPSPLPPALKVQNLTISCNSSRRPRTAGLPTQQAMAKYS
ncbi:hypothetical protein BGX38DRAFT_178558 [Terfezia claveryi]|nr:hypothetical protein BGX38DRAFT_178558 [Terfezia claveryi]